MIASPIRKRSWDVDPSKPESVQQFAANVGEMARDLEQYLGAIPTTRVIELSSQYQEPMYLAYDHNPKGIVCARIRSTADPETPVLSGGMVHWRWEGDRARIDSIDGMTPGGTNYTFTFLMVG